MLAKILGGGLKWLASFGTGMLASLLFYVLGLIGISEGKLAPILWAFIIAAVAKVVGALVATYGPAPTPETPPAMSAGRRP
jgi:hypothetical protein